jgi:hypothetical protein
VVKVKPTSDAEVARSAVTRGKAGVYMSVANGSTALCKASVNTKEVDTVAAPAAGPSCTPVEDEADESSRPVIATPPTSAEQL